MPLSEEKNQIANIGRLLEELSEENIEFILVGGLAAVIQGAPVTTFDVDIVHHQTEANIKKLLELLQKVDAYYRRPDDKIIKPDERDLSAKGHLLFRTNYGPLDILAMIENDNRYEDLLPHSVELEFKGRKIRVLGLSRMVELKRYSKDPKDIHRLPILESTLRQVEGDDK